MRKNILLGLPLVVAVHLLPCAARADFKDDLLKSLIKRITQEALSKILGDQVCAGEVDYRKKAPAGKVAPKKAKGGDDYCVRVKDGLEKSIAGVMNKDFYSVAAGVKDIGVAYLEKKYLDWLGESTFAKELEDYPYLSMKGGDSGEGLENFIRKAAAISTLVTVFANVPACVRWLSEEGKGDAAACRALARPEMLAKISWPDDATPDDQERLSDFFNAILDRERPDGYLRDRAAALLDVKAPPKTLPELFPYFGKIVRRHGKRLVEEFPWLGAAFTEAYPKMLAIAFAKKPCRADDATKKLRAFSGWIAKECVVNEVAMLKITAELLFRTFPGPEEKDPDERDEGDEANIPLWIAAQEVNQIRNVTRRLAQARMKAVKERREAREADLEGRVLFLIDKVRDSLTAASRERDDDDELKALRKAILQLLGQLEDFAKDATDAKEIKARGKTLRPLSKAFDEALEKAQAKLAHLVWLKNHPRLQQNFESTILESTSPEKIIGWMRELPQEVAQILVLATTGGELHRTAKFGHLVLFNTLGPSLDVQAIEEILYLCPQDAAPSCRKIRRLLLRSAAMRSVVWTMRALIDGNYNKVQFESQKTLMLISAYFYEELYNTLGKPLRAVLDLPSLALKAFGGVTGEVHKNGVDAVLDDLGACVHREYLKALLVFGFDPPSWNGRAKAVVEKMQAACAKESDYVRYFARKLATKGAETVLRDSTDDLVRAAGPALAITEKLYATLPATVGACGNAKEVDVLDTKLRALRNAHFEKVRTATLPAAWKDSVAKLRMDELAGIMSEGTAFADAIEPLARFTRFVKDARGRIADLYAQAEVISIGSDPKRKAACDGARDLLVRIDEQLKKIDERDLQSGVAGLGSSLKIISAMHKYERGLYLTVSATGSVRKYFSVLVENLANTLDELPMFSSLGDFGEPVKKFLTRLIRLVSPDSQEKISRKFVAPFGREVLDMLLKKLFISNRKSVQPLLKAVAELASNQLANIIFEENTGTLPQMLDAVKRGLLDVFERKSEFRWGPGLQLRLGLLSPFNVGCPPGLPCDAALKTIYREDFSIDVTTNCNAGDRLCQGFSIQLPSLIENLTRAIEGGDRGAKLGLEVLQRNLVQGDTLSFTFGPGFRMLYLKEKFPDTAAAVARTWVAVGGGFDLTFRFFGNLLAGLRARYFYDHRTFFHATSPEWSHTYEFGLYLGYGFNAVNWGGGR